MTGHPVKVPPELFTEWLSDALLQHDAKSGTVAAMVAERAAQWGADVELEACIRHLFNKGHHPTALDCLRAARRPKPPSLKQQALVQLSSVESDLRHQGIVNTDYIRRAMEAIPDD